MINIRKTLGLAVVSTLTLALSATTISLSTPAHAVDSATASTDVTLNLGAAISVRILDSTATSDLSLLSFDLTPTSTGVTSTKTAVVDVSTSNVTGYKLYVEANGKDHNNNYTTDLVQADQDDSHVIPTSTSTATNKNFWNYVNPSLGSTSVIPAHGTPDKINQEFTPTDSTKTNIDINIGVDTNITAGTYNNQLLFTAIANASSMGYTLNFLQNLPVGADPTTLENFPENQSATSVSTSYTFTIPSTAPSLLGYNFLGFLDPEAEPGEKGSTEDPYQAGDDVVVNADTSTSSSVMSGSKTLSANWNVITPTLTVDPAGGTWSGSTEAQTFTQAYGTTKTINLPSQNASYTISYNDNSQGATFTPTPTSAERSFTGWSLEATRAAGPGSWDPATSTYTFGTTNGTLSATYNETANAITLPTLIKTGYTCKWHENSASGTSHDSGETGVALTANVEFYAVCTINQYTLTVNPNGGTWGGSTSSQDFTQDYGTTKNIANPTVGPTYSISYNMGSTGITAPTSPSSIDRPFTSWSLTKTPSGTAAGSFDASSKTYTYGAGNDTLTANWNTTSNSFTLPTLEKTGHTCKWHLGSASGTEYDSGATNVTISANATFYATCTINQYALTVKPNGGTWNGKTTDQTFNQNYDTTKTIADPTAGPTYSISYNMGSTGITAPTSPTSVQRPFTSWTANPTSAWNSSTKTYTFPAQAGTLTANYDTTSNAFTLPALTKTGHTCKWHLGSASGTEYDSGAANVTITGNTTFYAVCTVNSYKLTVKPNGGTWNGKTTDQTFTQNYGTTKSIANPTAGPTYTIGYNMGSTGIAAPTSPTSVQRPFSSWSLSGAGSFAGNTYTYEAGNGTLTASYSSTSNKFTLPTITKTGHTCKWHLGSASGTEYASGATNVTITGNATFYAVCTANNYTVNITNNNTTSGASSLSVPYGGSKTVTVTPNSGYYLSAVSCPSGYTCSGYSTGTSATGTQTVTVKNNSATSTTTLSFTGAKLCTANHVCYLANEPSGTVSGTMEDQTIVYMTSSTAANTVDTNTLSSSTPELTLYSPNWTLTGYGFKGWNTKADGSGTMYGPNQTITLTAAQKTQLGTYGLPLYAQWVASAGNMASWSGCSSLAQGSVTALTYGSDTYAVAKLADGKCWMIENLRTSTNAGTATTSMSTSSYTSREYNLTNVSGTAGAYPINLTSPAAASSTPNQYSWKSYGGYYSWHSAINTTTAGSTQYTNWNGSSFSDATTATAQGICPAGWRLPRSYAGSATNNTESDFRYLNNQLNGSYSSVSTAAASNSWRTYPNNFVFAGSWRSSSSYNRGTYGLYWSSTVFNSYNAYRLYIRSTAVDPAYNYSKYSGLSVRCLIGS